MSLSVSKDYISSPFVDNLLFVSTTYGTWTEIDFTRSTTSTVISVSYSTIDPVNDRVSCTNYIVSTGHVSFTVMSCSNCQPRTVSSLQTTVIWVSSPQLRFVVKPYFFVTPVSTSEGHGRFVSPTHCTTYLSRPPMFTVVLLVFGTDSTLF